MLVEYEPLNKISKYSQSSVIYATVSVIIFTVLFYTTFIQDPIPNPPVSYGKSLLPQVVVEKKVDNFDHNRTDILPKTGVNAINALPPFLQSTTHLLFAQQFKVGACLLPKVMSTIMTGVMCYLHNPNNFTSHGRTIPTETYVTRFCRGDVERGNVTSWYNQFNKNNDYSVFTVVRDPIDRFISAYVDKCYIEHRTKPRNLHIGCYGCSEDMNCFIRRMKDRLWKYVADTTIILSMMDIHIIPQTWHCEMKEYMKRFKIFRYVSSSSQEYEIFLTELTDMLKSHNVPQENIDYVLHGLTGGHSPHTTTNSTIRAKYKKQLMSDPELLKIIVDLYYYDYVTFGFPFPSLE
ncbi:unnamed protein product [Bursaphelenchus okinawaensis]|uniref:Sulfotransfer_1 domain-containing protein n=1 Tax=Bursaphelenchus okinawaensis TaxID=465554 RepID=A0A811L3G1_9BILA|nr:unnamed protein product [Bursaphelenchus okinawaensis]CAG9118379.1 unnamed protein product [Bursaphelenchus okinawaensis]